MMSVREKQIAEMTERAREEEMINSKLNISGAGSSTDKHQVSFSSSSPSTSEVGEREDE